LAGGAGVMPLCRATAIAAIRSANVPIVCEGI
jgi:hypothetical protein